MKIIFTGKHVVTISGVNFEILVDNQVISCIVSDEALQDIDPSNALTDKQTQFLSNTYRLQDIAKNKILAGESYPIHIRSADVV